MGEQNGRVTTREFYEAQLKTDKRIADLRVLMVEQHAEHMETLALVPGMKDDIDENKKRSNAIDGINGFLLLIAAYIGWKQ